MPLLNMTGMTVYKFIFLVTLLFIFLPSPSSSSSAEWHSVPYGPSFLSRKLWQTSHKFRLAAADDTQYIPHAMQSLARIFSTSSWPLLYAPATVYRSRCDRANSINFTDSRALTVITVCLINLMHVRVAGARFGLFCSADPLSGPASRAHRESI